MTYHPFPLKGNNKNSRLSFDMASQDLFQMLVDYILIKADKYYWQLAVIFVGWFLPSL